MGYEDDQTDKIEEINLIESTETKISDNEKQLHDAKKETAAKLQEYLHLSEQRIGQLESQLEQIPNVIAATIEQALGQITQNQNQTTSSGLNDMPPELKAQMLSQLVQTLAQAYQSFKGGSVNPNQPDFQSMMAEWGMRMFNYHLDNMAQSVYQIRLPPPDSLRVRNMPMNQPQQQTPQHDQTVHNHRGHRFE